MQAIFAPAAAYLILYAPGHYLLRYGGSAQPGPGSRLLREILLSACCTSCVGLLLADLSIYSLPSLLLCLTAVAVAAARVTRGSRPPPYAGADLLGVSVVLLSWLWISPPLDTRILGSDSAGYLAAGIHLSRHGSLIIHDPTLSRLSVDLKRVLFPSVTLNPGSPPYLRLVGSLILRSLDTDEVLPAFHHLTAVWIAVFHGLAGAGAAQWAITLFGGLSIWAMVEFATELGGTVTAFVFFVLLSLCSVQNWYSRFLMPEIPAQFFLWAGLACVSFWCRTHRRADTVLAGLAFGVAGLMRIENAAFLSLTLAATVWVGDRGSRRDRLVLCCAAVTVWLYATAHLLVFRTHYLGNLLSLFPETFGVFVHTSRLQIGLLTACLVLLAAVLVWKRRRGLAWLNSHALISLVALVVCLSVWGDWRNGWPTSRLFIAYLGIPTLVGGAVGLGVWMAAAGRRTLTERVFLVLLSVTFAQVMLAPHATPVPIWTVRRAATTVLPAFCLGVALLAARLAQRGSRAIAAVIVALAIVGQALPLAKLRWRPHYHGGLRHVQAVAAMLPAGACLLFDGQLAGWGFAPALWAERDLPAYFRSRYDVRRISELLQALDGVPLYWISNGTVPPPRIPGVDITPVAFYEFTMLTPTLDLGSAPGTEDTEWDSTVAVYLFQPQRRPPDGAPLSSPPA